MHRITYPTAYSLPAPVTPTPVLTRASLEAGAAEALIADQAPGVRLLSAQERRGTLEACLRSRPVGDVWVFAYGSLIWNPALKVAERRAATIEGWHRAFCLSMPTGRGSPCNPGLALGLDVGGSCHGAAYRIAEDDLQSELAVLWNREMLIGGYSPRWVELLDGDGVAFGHAIAFVLDTNDPLYAGHLNGVAVVNRLATAGGSWGSSADYLFRTRDALREIGIPDAGLEVLGLLVERAQATSSPAIAA